MKAQLILPLLCVAALPLHSLSLGQTPDPATPPGWRSIAVDSAGTVGTSRSIAFTPAGHLVIGYSDSTNNRVKVASWDPLANSWSFEAVGVGYSGVSLALHPITHEPAVSWTNRADGRLYYASKGSTGSWQVATIETSGVSSYAGTSLAYDPQGDPAICYFYSTKSASGLKFARRTGSIWKTQVISTAGGSYSGKTVAFDSQGNAAVTYPGSLNVLLLAIGKRMPDGVTFNWVKDVIIDQRDEGLNSSIAFDANDNLLVVHCAEDHVRFLRRSGLEGAWSPVQEFGHDQALAHPGLTHWYASLALGDGTISVAYLGDAEDGQNSFTRLLWLATASINTTSGEEWSIKLVESTELVSSAISGIPAIDVDSAGIRHLSYDMLGDLLVTSEDASYAGPRFDFNDDMESGILGWTSEGNSKDSTTRSRPPTPSTDPAKKDLWHQTMRRAADAGHSPVHSWYYGIEGAGNYITGTRNWGRLESPNIDLATATRAELKLAQLVMAEGGTLENGEIQISVLEGAQWTPWTTISSSSSRTDAIFNTTILNMNPYIGKTIRLGFFFDTKDGKFNQFEGWYIDDVNVKIWE